MPLMSSKMRLRPPSSRKELSQIRGSVFSEIRSEVNVSRSGSVLILLIKYCGEFFTFFAPVVPPDWIACFYTQRKRRTKKNQKIKIRLFSKGLSQMTANVTVPHYPLSICVGSTWPIFERQDNSNSLPLACRWGFPSPPVVR
jgi:hypothetical protein